MDALSLIFSGASSLLYVLCKNSHGNLRDVIHVEPLDVRLGTTANASKLHLHRLQSSSSFFVQMKKVVGTCYWCLLSNVASKFDPLLESIIFADFSKSKVVSLPNHTLHLSSNNCY